MSVNKVTLLGNVGKDPEIRTTQDGRKIANFSLATSDKWRDKSSGELREKTEWHRVVVYNENLANIVEKYLEKGNKVYLEGSLQTRKWQANDGSEKYTTEIVLQGFNSRIEIVDSKRDSNQSSSSNYDEPINDIANIEDDIPF